MIRAHPGTAPKISRRAFCKGRALWQSALKSLECATNIVAQLLEEGARARFPIFQLRATHAHLCGIFIAPCAYSAL
jgi:hypothetical protein